MTPALNPGDYVVVDTRAYTRRDPAPGQVVLASDPREPSRMIAKRVAGPDGADGVVLLGDNSQQSTDSRTFGPVHPGDITGRVFWRYWPPARFGPVR